MLDRIGVLTEADAAALRQRYPAATIDLIDAEMTSWYGSRAVAGLRYLRAVRTPIIPAARLSERLNV